MNRHPHFRIGIIMLALVAGASGSKPQLALKPAGGGAQTVPIAATPGPVVESPGSGTAVRAAVNYGRMPLHFIANQGQMDQAVDYYVPGGNKTIYFSPGGLTILMSSGEGAPERWAVKLDFIGSDPACRPSGKDKADAVVSYFKGKPEDWTTGVPTYSQIAYHDIWPGIDLVYSGTFDRLKYEFVVRSGADPSRIQLAYRGASEVKIRADGRLEVKTPAGGFADDIPAAYQEIEGRRAPVSAAYKLLPEGESARSSGPENTDGEETDRGFVYGFEVGAYDKSQTLILDPAVFVYCGFVGGSGTESGTGIAVDAASNAYVTGTTISTETTFPVVAGPDLTFNAGLDVFVAKVNAAGTGLVYCGFIGGDNADHGTGIAVDTAGCAYVTGTTQSSDTTFPVTVGPDLIYGAHPGTGGYPDAFVAKLSADGTGLVYCGYIGGQDQDEGRGIAVDGSGCAYVTGFTTNYETTFPTLVGPDLTYNGGADIFVTKVNAAGTGFVYSGYIGGAGSEYGYGIAVDESGNAYITGTAYASSLPVTVGPDLTFNGLNDAYVAKVNASGTALDYCGFIGGDGSDEASGIAVDGAGCAYVIGHTLSSAASFPLAVGPDLSANGDRDAFVAKVGAAGSQLDYCGYLGGSLGDNGNGIAVDGKGNAYVTGETASSESSFPVVSGPDLTYNANRDAFIAKIRPSGYGFEYCGYIGGTNYDWGSAVAVDGSGNAYVTGKASFSAAPGFPVTGGPDLTFNGGPEDAFVAKVYYFDENLSKHAVGDFDGDGADEAAVDFGASGVWVWDGGPWGQILPADPENLMAADSGGADVIIADLGMNGLWLWNGAWSGLSNSNPESLAPADVDADGADEIAVDFGSTGLWLWNGGIWTQLSASNADYVTAFNAYGSGGEEIAADFGFSGLWLWNGGVWSQISGVNPNHIRRANIDGLGAEDLVGDFGSLGAWVWGGGAWTQISGARPDYLIAANVDGATGDEVVGDFGATGLWLRAGGTWNQLSGVNADYLISADTDGDGSAEILADFGVIGLWLWNAGAWIQISGANPEYMIAGNFDGDNHADLMVDFGTLGVWLWDEGTWSQISNLNPD